MSDNPGSNRDPGVNGHSLGRTFVANAAARSNYTATNMFTNWQLPLWLPRKKYRRIASCITHSHDRDDPIPYGWGNPDFRMVAAPN